MKTFQQQVFSSTKKIIFLLFDQSLTVPNVGYFGEIVRHKIFQCQQFKFKKRVLKI